MFRFTSRDLLWLTAVVGFASMWWIEFENSRRLRRDRDEVIAKWHHASQMWVEATRMRSQPRSSGALGGGGGMGGGGMGSTKGKVLPPMADEAADSDEKEKSMK
jgi:hypothetical protein